MREYSRESWGISRTEYDRLVAAVEQGIITDSIAEGHRYELLNGYKTADELIRSFDFGKRFYSELSQNRDHIDENEFQRIVEETLNRSRDVESFQVFKMAVEIRLYSRSGKTKWNTFLDFDDCGKITGKYSYTQGYEGATQPWVIGDEISRRIKSSLYD